MDRSRTCFQRARRAAAVLLVISGGLASSSEAALPPPTAVFTAYDHAGGARGFHLRFAVGSNPRLIRTAFLESSACHVGPVVRSVPVSGSGDVYIYSAFAPRLSQPRLKTGVFNVVARFTSPTRLNGTYQAKKPGCDTGVRAFTAATEKGHTADGPPPDVAGATPAQRAEAEALLAASRQAASRFPTIGDAFRAGFVPHPGFKAAFIWPRGVGFHLENCRNWVDDRVLDPARPEALVYWSPPNAAPVPIASMYRVSSYQPPPTTGGPIVQWHGHGDGAFLMTHVWFASRLEEAFSTSVVPSDSFFSSFSLKPQNATGWPWGGLGGATGDSYCLRSGRHVRRLVKMRKTIFSRRAVVVPPGGIVSWRFNGRKLHELVAGGTESFGSPATRSGTYRHRFFWPGRTRVICAVHPSMRMTVVVRR
jgi:plastocyanin